MNAANSFLALFKSTLGDDFLRLETSATQLGLSLADAEQVPADFSSRSILYPDVLPQVDLRYDLLAVGVKETLVLKGPNAPRLYRFVVRQLGGENVVPRMMTDGRIVLESRSTGRPLLSIERPFVDPLSTENLGRASGAVRLDARASEAGVFVDLIIDDAWLSSPSRRFPIEIDPTMTTLGASSDETYPDCIGNQDLCVAQNIDRLPIGSGAEDQTTPRSQVSRAALEFDLSAIPAESALTGAELGLYFDGICIDASQVGVFGTECESSHTITAHVITEAPGNYTPDFDSTVEASFVLPDEAAAQWMEWDLLSVAGQWFEGDLPNHGVLLRRSPDPEAASGPAPPSAEYTADPDLRPRLSVTYVAPGEYEYDEALDLGLDTPPTPEDMNLPECEDDPEAAAYASAEAAEEAAEEAPEDPVCVADPSDAIIGVGGSDSAAFEEGALDHIPHLYAGAQTGGKFEGGRASIEVANPAVDHGDDEEVALARVLSKRKNSANQWMWLEIGWAERWKWPAGPFVYTFKKRDSVGPTSGQWIRHPSYPVSAGKYIIVRVRDCPAGACAEILWTRDGETSWEPIRTNHSMHCRQPGGSLNLCYQEFYLEVFTEDSEYPALNTSNGVDFPVNQLRTEPNNWILWDGAVFSAVGDLDGDEPYDTCWSHQYWAFRAGKGIGDQCN